MKTKETEEIRKSLDDFVAQINATLSKIDSAHGLYLNGQKIEDKPSILVGDLITELGFV